MRNSDITTFDQDELTIWQSRIAALGVAKAWILLTLGGINILAGVVALASILRKSRFRSNLFLISFTAFTIGTGTGQILYII